VRKTRLALASRLLDGTAFESMGVFRKKAKESMESTRAAKTPVPRGKAAPKSAPKVPGRFKLRVIKLLTYLGMAAIVTPIAAGGAALGGLKSWLESSPGIAEFDNYNPPETTTILDKDGKPLAALFEQRRAVIPITEMPAALTQGFVSIEDERFYQHMGVDPAGVVRAALINASRGNLSQGASTITQQTARNLIPSIGTDKTGRRKVMELLVALRMEHRYAKQQILEVYLNQIYLGSGAYGVEAAAKIYFGKHAKDLTIEECATIAGLPQLPERYSPLNNPDLARRRRDQVLGKMWEHGFLDDAEFDRTVTTEVMTDTNGTARSRAPYFVDAVRRVVADHPALGGDKLQTAGWRIKATVDPKVQEIAEDVLARALENEEVEWIKGRQERWLEAQSEEDFARAPQEGQMRMGEVVGAFEKSLVVKLPGGWKADLEIPTANASYFRKGESINVGEGVDVEITEVDTNRGTYKGWLLPRQRLQGAIVCLDVETGDVRALVGGRGYNDRLNNGYFNRAILARRQAGSTFKPFFYACGFEHGLLPTSTFYDGPITFADGYSPKNYEKKFFGATSLQTALEKSRNIPTIKLVQSIGLRTAIDYVKRFQRTGDEPWDIPLEWPVVLGTTSVTPLELACAYQAIANRGVARGPRLIEKVWNQDDRESVALPETETSLIVSPHADAMIQQLMMGVMTHGTGEKLLHVMPESLRLRVAGKSGTTNDNRDAWFAGFTPHEVVVVWLGFDQNILLAPHRTGSKAAGPVWAEFVARTWELKTPEEQQEPLHLPRGYVAAAINPSTGRVVEPGSPDWVDPPTWRVYTETEYELHAPAEAPVETLEVTQAVQAE
jgi:penicillin-binding protein 1A